MTPDDDRIRQRAYELWQQDGSQHGRHEQHWADAEREILGAATPQTPAEGDAAPGSVIPTPRTRSSAPKTPRKRTPKSPLADAGAAGGTAGTGGTFRDQDQ